MQDFHAVIKKVPKNTIYMNKGISIIKIYYIFLRIGAILLGGGYVILPILESELCSKRKLINSEELINYFTLSQSLPGIVAANISMFIGYKFRGKFGAFAAMLGIITIPFFSIVVLASLLKNLVGNQYINGIFWGIGFAVIALIILTVREVWQKTNRNGFFYLIFLTSLIALLIFKMSPVDVILIFCIIGVIIKTLFRKRDA